jgi:hypothetical protein
MGESDILLTFNSSLPINAGPSATRGEEDGKIK